VTDFQFLVPFSRRALQRPNWKLEPRNWKLEAAAAPENSVAALRILNYAFEADKTRQSEVHSEAGFTDDWPGKE